MGFRYDFEKRDWKGMGWRKKDRQEDTGGAGWGRGRGWADGIERD